MTFNCGGMPEWERSYPPGTFIDVPEGVEYDYPRYSRDDILAKAEAAVERFNPRRDPDDLTALDEYDAEDDPC